MSGTNWIAVWWQGASGSAPSYTVTVGGRTVAQQTASGQPTVIPWDTTTVANGSQTITVTGIDGAGQTAFSSVNVTVAN